MCAFASHVLASYANARITDAQDAQIITGVNECMTHSNALASHAIAFCANERICAYNLRKRHTHNVSECAHDVTVSNMKRVTILYFMFSLKARLIDNKGGFLHMFTSKVFVVFMIFRLILPSRSKAFVLFCFVLLRRKHVGLHCNNVAACKAQLTT